ncbi:hypothetical protein GGR52DRAFT_562517 [Hypoxylon sp. FL1284]|nr:hypothetical protein GGR52DRAFT_562517 [Hypoxylon sp. FL1284]
MTGAHKQKRPRPLPGVGKLELEADNPVQDVSGRPARRPGAPHLTQYDMRLRRGAAKDVWPTVQNFAEELAVRKRNPAVPENEKITPSTLTPQPTPVPETRESIRLRHVPPLSSRQRAHSEFENFGRRLQTQIPASVGNSGAPVAHVDQPDNECDGEHDEYEEGETGEEYELEEDEGMSSDRGEDDTEQDKERSHDEEASDSVHNQESPRENLVTSRQEDAGPGETEAYTGDLWANGDIAREFLESSQAFS